MSLSLKLTDAELRYAAYAGVDRQVSALAHGRADQFKPRDYWGTHVNGALAELAVAKWRGRFWCGFADEGFHDDPDVGRTGEVRASTNLESPLRLRERDRGKADSPFVLAVVDPPFVHLVGWAYGRDVMVDEFWREGDTRGPGCWAMPQDRITNPINPPKGPSE